MKESMREALRHTLKELKASMRERRAKAYTGDEDDDEHSEVADRRTSGRSAGAGADAGGDGKELAGQEGRSEEVGPEEKSDWRASQKDFMKGKHKQRAEATLKVIPDFGPVRKKAAATTKTVTRAPNGKFEKKREVTS